MYLVTGCNGLVGSFIARKLLAENCTVTAIRRKTSDMRFVEDIAAQINWIETDLLDVTGLHTAMKDATYVIHAAAVVSFLPKDRNRMQQINVEGTANVVNCCLENNIKKLIHISSVAALGNGTQMPITEKTSWDKSDVSSAYAQTKFEAERHVWRGIAEGLPACIINPSVVLGAGDLTKTSNQLFQYALTEPYFAPMGALNVVDVRDVADMVYLLLTQPIENESFIMNSTKIPYLDFFTQLATLLKIKAPKQEAKVWQLYVAFIATKIASLFSSKVTPLSMEMIRNAQRKTTYNTEKVQKILNFQFRPLEDTLQWVCTYYKNAK